MNQPQPLGFSGYFVVKIGVQIPNSGTQEESLQGSTAFRNCPGALVSEKSSSPGWHGEMSVKSQRVHWRGNWVYLQARQPAMCQTTGHTPDRRG